MFIVLLSAFRCYVARNRVSHTCYHIRKIIPFCVYCKVDVSIRSFPMRYSILILSLGLIGTLSASDRVDFNKDVRPILSDRCFKCHGPDAKNQKSDYRVDTFEHATANLGDYYGIVPGNAEDSELFYRLITDDEIDLMPPPENRMALTEEEIDIIKRWINQGAEYQKHWSFTAIPDSIEVPKTQSDWARNPIDHFILNRLEQEQFTPSPETSREKWLRRITFDLTGLPPTLPALDAFLADTSPNAYDKVVERLLASPAYGERMAGEWLNVARYSDTFGYQQDWNRRVWPWRDWVIEAFQGNMPYDQFIIEQLAGDLLPNPTRNQILATTFNRLHSQKNEGGSVPEEFRIEYVADRVHTFGTAFLGLSFECSRCHDHKYDPLTMQDYYEVAAYFDNIDEAGLYAYFPRVDATPPPTLWLPDKAQEAKLADLDTKIAASEARLTELAKIAAPAFEKWMKNSPGKVSDAAPIASFDFESNERNKIPNLVEGGDPATTSGNNQLVDGRNGKAVQLTGDDKVTLPVGNFSRNDSFTISLWLKTPDEKKRAVVFSRSKAWTDAASRGYELLIEDGELSLGIIHFYPGDAIRVRTTEKLPVGEWKHVAVSYDGSSRASGVTLYVDGQPADTRIIRDHLTRDITGGGSDTIVIGSRMRDNGFTGGLVDDFQIFNKELDPAEVAQFFERSEWQPGIDWFLANAHPPYQKETVKLKQLRNERIALIRTIPDIMVMKEMEEPKPTYLLGRGHYSNREKTVSAATPDFLPSQKVDTPQNRLDLARWTASDDNPLTARVTVNRYWQLMFGAGLVSTPEDFGSQGRSPTHPQLLDWLARDFIESGWNVQHLLRQMALSATYRQSSNVSSGELTTLDPENTLLYRFPAPRLSAEMIRDNALAASGLLNNEVGGAPVKPYDIAVSFKPTKISQGDDLYRRSLYTYWRQTSPAPMMTTLNASKRDVCRVSLEKTDSPLQGLVLLNSPQFVEAARTLAEDLVNEYGNDNDAIINETYRRLTSRQPDQHEWPVLRHLIQEQEKHFATGSGAARELISVGASKAPETENPARLAAVTTLVSTVMNFDECITKR